jgi:FAD-dependent oxidoreductase family protein
MNRSRRAILKSIASLLAATALPVRKRAWGAAVDPPAEYDVVIAGGSTAAFAAAIAAARQGARVVLLEPTDWTGGQLTASGVPAVDEAWHRIVDPDTKKVLLDVAGIARDPQNVTPTFRDMLQAIGNPGRGWVSRYCFEPRVLLDGHLLPLEKSLRGRLTVFRNTVVKRVDVDEARGRVLCVEAIERKARPGVADKGYDRRLSEDLADWYSRDESSRFEKRVLAFGNRDDAIVFIDATEWGELLALADAPYLIGVEDEDGGARGNEGCGQSIVFTFVQRLSKEVVDEPLRGPAVEHLGYGKFRDKPDAWEQVWTYRRIRSSEKAPAFGDLSLQNWEYSFKSADGGNDYPFGYLFKSKAATRDERSDWRGGVKVEVLVAAEQRALAWHDWFKQHAPAPFTPRNVSLAFDVLGTGHGLAKMPYLRDTRRSIGIDGFLLKFSDLTGPAEQKTGTKFADRVALGAYAADIHGLVGCKYPGHTDPPRETLPFYIPLRALTNEKYGNLIVAGKTMAQSFLANSATRLHPIEWSSGTAAGVVAAWMAERKATTADAQRELDAVRDLIAKQTPVDWVLPS